VDLFLWLVKLCGAVQSHRRKTGELRVPLSRRWRIPVCAAAFLSVSLPTEALVHGAYHILPLPGYFQKTGHLPPGGGDGPVYYYGGSVFANVRVVSVLWNKDVLQNTKDQVPPFSAALVNGTYIDQMGEFGTLHQKAVNGHKSTKQVIGRGSYYGQVVFKPHNAAKQLSDADIQAELKRQIRNGVLPARDANTLYMIYFPADVIIDLDGLISCQQFGAYHFATNDTKIAPMRNIFYSVEPECNSGFDYLTYAASHEFAEAVTDNVPTPGNSPDYPQAWNDVNGLEVGDLCPFEGTLTDGTNTWTVTQFYLDSLEGCSTADYFSP
jgi:hypothetical protein